MSSPAIRKASPWIVVPAPKPAARARLFCFPFAGAGAAAFHAWARKLPAYLELCILQLPGRESRMGQKPISDWGVLMDALSGEFRDWTDRPFAFFGHSLGATMAFELTRRLRREGRPLPIHLFVSGRAAPQLPLARPPVHHLSDAEFRDELRDLQGTPEEVLQNEELMEFILPLLRADFTLAETHPYHEEPPFGLPISAFGGVEDPYAPEDALDAWRAHTSARFRRTMYPGGHFYLQDPGVELVAAIEEQIRATLAGEPGAS